ncbi:C45 family autoproteolytic acyltransferase/hydrolase [Bradyrhizobium erythrophlei]|uniref:C45 family autoproteolytic acyltransferase/hydolase n=1 Tax=Bradyrhizobium erythrophlei TaxID=1437360 RepID=UPI0035E71699
MVHVFRSTELVPHKRGEEFGAVHADRINESIRAYSYIYSELVGRKLDFKRDFSAFGLEALKAIRDVSPSLCDEIEGMAAGAGLDSTVVGALNARTEILAKLRAAYPGECSAVVHVEPSGDTPIALQNWDWFEPAADNWLVWEIPHQDGSLTTTFTEFGMVGKIGINNHGIGVLFTILRHAHDGKGVGFPVHVAARHVLDEATNIARAMRLLVAAKVSASSSINLVSVEAGKRTAVSVELFPGGPGFVFPDGKGLLVRTNHFLSTEGAKGDLVPTTFPDTLLRRDILMRSFARLERPTVEDILAAMTDRVGGEFAVCAIPTAGQPRPVRKTAATIILDFDRASLKIIDRASDAPLQ